MDIKELIGKTIKSATKINDGVDGWHFVVGFTDGSFISIEAAHGESRPDCADEYPDYVNIKEIQKPILKDLGWANGWNNCTPEIILECREMNHKPDYTYPQGKNRGVEKITCLECGYFYQTDSGG